MLKFENSNDKKCFVCGKENEHTQKININRKVRKDNIVSFDICDDCLIEMFGDIGIQLENLNEYELYRS